MMERLTNKESAGYDLIKMNNEWCIDYCKEQPVQTCRSCAIHESIQKLAYYEDLEERISSIYEDITIEMIVGEIESEHNKSIETILSLCKKLKEMNKL